MNKDDIRRIARLGGVKLNETLCQKMEEAEIEARLDEVLTRAVKGAINLGAELNKISDQVVGRAVTLGILEAEEEAQEEAEKQGMAAKELRNFVAGRVAGESPAIQRRVKETTELLHKLMQRKLPSEISKQLKEFQRANK